MFLQCKAARDVGTGPQGRVGIRVWSVLSHYDSHQSVRKLSRHMENSFANIRISNHVSLL